jgi:uncharacterized protein YkwD
MAAGNVARRCAVLCAAMLVAAAAASGAGATSRAPASALSPLESSVLADINAFRAQHGLTRLGLNASLTHAAQAHSQQMAKDGYFAHESVDGTAFWKRVASFYRSSSWRFWSVGENLLWQSPNIGGAAALRLWLASPEHRSNLMNPRWREIGVSAVHVAHAPGVYAGRSVTIVTTDFGVRR